METSRSSHAPQQDFWTRRGAHILEAHSTLADARIACQRLAGNLYIFRPPSLTFRVGHVSLTSTADRAELEDRIRCLGLQFTRSRRLIALSTAYLARQWSLCTQISCLIDERTFNLPRYHRSGAGLPTGSNGRPHSV